MTSASSFQPTAGPTRRIVLTAGAWSAPAIALAVAAPALAASTGGAALSLEWARFGEAPPWAYDTNLQNVYQARQPGSVLIRNDGPDDLPATQSVTLSLSYDNRLFSLQGVSVGFDGPIIVPATVLTSANTTTHTYVLSTAIPADTDPSAGINVISRYTYLPGDWQNPDPAFAWPEYSTVEPPVWTLLSPGSGVRSLPNGPLVPARLKFVPANRGSDPSTAQTPDGHTYAAPNPDVKALNTSGPQSFAGTFDLEVQYDNRLFDLQTMRWTDGPGDVAPTSVSVNGVRTTAIWTITAAMPVAPPESPTLILYPTYAWLPDSAPSPFVWPEYNSVASTYWSVRSPNATSDTDFKGSLV